MSDADAQRTRCADRRSRAQGPLAPLSAAKLAGWLAETLLLTRRLLASSNHLFIWNAAGKQSAERPAQLPGITNRRDSGIFPQSNFIARGAPLRNAPAKSSPVAFHRFLSASSRLRYSPFPADSRDSEEAQVCSTAQFFKVIQARDTAAVKRIWPPNQNWRVPGMKKGNRPCC